MDMLDEVGLSERQGIAGVLQRHPHEFSGGQRQRIAIARSGDEARLQVLDEPTRRARPSAITSGNRG